MANQSIALQVRAPQTDILGGAIRNNAQMINMMAQQQAAQRQNAIAEQTMQIQRAKEGREAAMAAPQLAEAQSRAGSARQDFVVKAVGHALHTSVNNPTDETLDQAAATLAGIGLNPAEIDREITPIKQLPLDQRKPALMQSILSDPNSKAAFEATAPKLVHIKLNDRDIARDNNPLSPSFGQTFSTDIMGVSPNTVFNKTMRGAAPARVSGGGGGGGVPSGRGGAALAADGGGRPAQSQRPSKGAQPTAGAPSADARAIALQNLYDVIEEAHKKGHLVSEDQSYVANRAQELLTGRTYLPGGTAKKTSLDSIDAAANQLLRMYTQKGTSGTLNTKPEQEAFLRSVGGGDITYDARMKTIRNFAKQNGIKLNDYANKPSAGNAPAKPAANIGKPPPGVSATEWQYMTPEERKEMLK
jgi:hypothetical protein